MIEPDNVEYADLQDLARKIYDHANESLGSVTSDSAIGKLLDVQLKALRLLAELREKAMQPRQLKQLELQLNDIEQKISAHHAGNTNRASAQAPGTGKRPDWEQ